MLVTIEAKGQMDLVYVYSLYGNNFYADTTTFQHIADGYMPKVMLVCFNKGSIKDYNSIEDLSVFVNKNYQWFTFSESHEGLSPYYNRFLERERLKKEQLLSEEKKKHSKRR